MVDWCSAVAGEVAVVVVGEWQNRLAVVVDLAGGVLDTVAVEPDTAELDQDGVVVPGTVVAGQDGVAAPGTAAAVELGTAEAAVLGQLFEGVAVADRHLVPDVADRQLAAVLDVADRALVRDAVGRQPDQDVAEHTVLDDQRKLAAGQDGPREPWVNFGTTFPAFIPDSSIVVDRVASGRLHTVRSVWLGLPVLVHIVSTRLECRQALPRCPSSLHLARTLVCSSNRQTLVWI